eukprot:TRINITY_DN1244_c0_g1_i1.p1 TRINITY_DN1244_c0_g1~~TRINITY_DN1244_c0_g1_i1.p1  ORF type:complete len:113 (+),score=23.85 TRINITY_DN1244_c0_g1_i1:249-587(+)
MLVDLAGGLVLLEQISEGSLSSDPKNLDGHSSVLGTSSFTESSVSSLALGLEVVSSSGSGVHGDLPLDDEAVVDQLLDRSSGGGEGDLGGLVGVEPNSSLSAFEHGGSESLL